MSTKTAWIGASMLASVAVACGGGATPSPATPAAPGSADAPSIAAPAAAAPTASAAAAPKASAAPAAEAPAEANDAPEKTAEFQLVTKTAEGRPMVQYTDAKGVTTTLGQHGGILKVGDFATLRVPDGALREGMNVTFALDPKAKGPGSGVGPVYKVGPEIKAFRGKFQIVLAVPKGLKTPGFAVEHVTTNAKSGRSTTEWEKLRPTHVFVGNEPDLAVLELEVLPDAHVTLTSSAP